MPKVDIPSVEVSKENEGYRYVTVPSVDIFDHQHPGIRINNAHYGPGTHFLPKEVADTVEDRLKAFERANIRLLRPEQDKAAKRVMERGYGEQSTNFGY